jgi:Mg-chelatase subunit ChlD
MRLRSLLSLLLVFLFAVEANAIVNCFDYAFYRATGVDPRPPNSVQHGGMGFSQIECYLSAMGYSRLPSPARSDSDLSPGDVLLFGTAHAGFVTPSGRIDHFIQVWGTSGVKHSAGSLPPAKLYLSTNRVIFPDPPDNKHSGNFLGHTLAQFMGSAFRPAGEVYRWRKTGSGISGREILDLEVALIRADEAIANGNMEAAASALASAKGVSNAPGCLSGQIAALEKRFDDLRTACRVFVTTAQESIDDARFTDAEKALDDAKAKKCNADPNTGVLLDGLRNLIAVKVQEIRDDIAQKVNACEYEAAEMAAKKLRSYLPARAWLQRDYPFLEKQAEGQKSARQHLQNGLDAIQRKDLKGAASALDQAALVTDVPNCMSTKIAELRRSIERFRTFSNLTEEVEKATEVCDYKEAARLIGEITRISPREQYVTDYLNITLPKLAELQNRERRALELMRQADAIVKTADAESQKETADWNGLATMLQQAGNLLKQADLEAPKCLPQRSQLEQLRLLVEAIAKRKKPEIGSSIILLIDTSGSMGDNGKIEQAKAAARIAARQVSKTTEIAVLHFDGGCDAGAMRVAANFTTDQTKLLTAIEGLGPGGGTPMYIAAAAAAEYARKTGRGKQKSIVLLSDGADTCRDQKAKASATIRSSNIPVSTIGYDVGNNATAQGELGEIASISGGRTFSASAADPREIIKAVRDAMLPNLLKKSDVSGPAGAQFQRAQTMVEQKDIAGALMTLQQANQLAPDSPNLNFNLSLLYESQDQLIPALNHANSYLNLAPGAIDSADVRNRINDIQQELRRNPRTIMDPSACRDVLAWAQTERDISRRAGNASRVQAALEIVIASQRGECDKARSMQTSFKDRYR